MQRSLVLATLALPALLVACNGDGDSDTDVQAQCTTQVGLFPAPNTTNAYYRTVIEATFTGAGAEFEAPTITVTGPDGEISGQSELVGNRLVFEPDSPLSPAASYETSVSYGCAGGTESATASWTVSEVGAPTSLGDLVGNAYSLDIASARFVEPPGVGPALATFIDFELLLGVESVDDTAGEIVIVGAVADDETPGVQAACEQTIAFPAADISENPYFQLGPQTLTISVQGEDITIEDLFVAGSFAPDGSYIDGAVLQGTVDTRPFATLVDPEGGENAVCELVEGLGLPGVACIDCPDGTGAFCLDIEADSIGAEAVPTPIDPIPDPCALPECQSDPDCQN